MNSPKSKVQSPKLWEALAVLTVWLLVLLVLVWAVPAHGELTATVTPGYVFSSGEAPTTAKLNHLATPTVSVSGTLTGTAGLAAGTVNGEHLADNFVDDDSINWTNSSPRAIAIKAAGVKKTHLNTNVAGFGLSGGAGTALFINTPVLVDTNTITTNASGLFMVNMPGIIDTNLVTTNASGRLTLNGHTNTLFGANGSNLATNLTLGPMLTINATNSLVVTGYVSGNISLPGSAGSVADQAHGLVNKPRVVRWVLICTSTDVGYSVSDEVEIAGFGNQFAVTIFAGGANASNVYLSVRDTSIYVNNKSTGALTPITNSKWSAKVYAFP